MSKAKITIEGDLKLMGYLYEQIRHLVNPETTPLTKITTVELRTTDEHKITFEVESRI